MYTLGPKSSFSRGLGILMNGSGAGGERQVWRAGLAHGLARSSQPLLSGPLLCLFRREEQQLPT